LVQRGIAVNPRQMNPRQRQGLLLVVIALVGLIGVFLLIANYVSSVSRQVGPKIQVLELTAPLSAYQPVTASMLGEVSLPAKWASRESIQDPAQVEGLISQVKLPAGTVLEQGMLTSQPSLPAGYQEIAILVDAQSGVAGQITPGSLVDIDATYGAGSGGRSSARVVVPAAKVIAVGTVSGGSSGQSSSSTNTPITFALTPDQVLKVDYAESFASNVRLSLVAPGTTGRPANPPPYAPGL
jgi:pilus assembly protein CpaB